jgi:hypothetical protein
MTSKVLFSLVIFTSLFFILIILITLITRKNKEEMTKRKISIDGKNKIVKKKK